MNNTSFDKCKNKDSVDPRPFEYTLSLIGGKWKMNILFWLWRTELMRYSELKKSLDGITHKMLSAQLKELEADDLIVRHEFPQVPPKVEYYLLSYLFCTKMSLFLALRAISLKVKSIQASRFMSENHIFSVTKCLFSWRMGTQN